MSARKLVRALASSTVAGGLWLFGQSVAQAEDPEVLTNLTGGGYSLAIAVFGDATAISRLIPATPGRPATPTTPPTTPGPMGAAPATVETAATLPRRRLFDDHLGQPRRVRVDRSGGDAAGLIRPMMIKVQVG